MGEIKEELGDLTIEIILDEKKKTITISDKGIGMSSEEIKKYINQIAFSGATEFIEKYKVKFDLLSDEEKEALKAFKVWGKKKFMGKEFMGVIRSTFVIKNNKIIKEWRSVKVKDHAKEVLEFIKNN